MQLPRNLLFGILLAAAVVRVEAAAPPRDLTFFQVSDTHYGTSPAGDDALARLVEAMNNLPGAAYPADLGGTVGIPRGVIHTGDLTNDGKEEQWRMFVRDYGLNGRDGKLRWPVFETYGNHDGGEKLPVRTGIRERNRTREGLAAVSDNGLHYSWEWDGVRFINCGIAPGTVAKPYDPQGSMEFLRDDLLRHTGGGPVILLHHFGFDRDHSLGWWSEERREQYFGLIRDVHVLGILHGHAHRPFISEWQGFDVFHPPHIRGADPKKKETVTHGFFVFHLTDDELTVAERRLDGTWGMTARRPIAARVPVPASAEPPPVPAPPRDVTFISTSDCHYREENDPRGNHNTRNRDSVLEMNAISDREWPEKLGGGKIGVPRGVLVLGDVIDDGDLARDGRSVSEAQYRLFLADFGLGGGDGLLRYPVFEGWGNHDGPPVGKEKHGFSFRKQLMARNQVRLSEGRILNLSTNGLHYSWDWDDVHFVQLNFYPANTQRAGVKYSPVWHDPQGSLDFLTADLAAKVGDSGRPVVLMAHCGFDTDWWTKEDWREFHAAAKDYNVVLYLYGHSGTSVGTWSPEGEQPVWNIINDGQTEKGFFVIRITGDRLRAAMRIRSRPDPARKDAAPEWEWKWLLDKPLNRHKSLMP
jgi:cytolysin (calcineurin-like family phosphatase)